VPTWRKNEFPRFLKKKESKKPNDKSIDLQNSDLCATSLHPNLETFDNFEIDQSLINWIKGNYELPCPNFIKTSVLMRNGSKVATWIETGTYLGETTEILAKDAKQVFSIEPSAELYKNAQKKLGGYKNITLLNGLSENLLTGVLEGIEDSHVCFWLDGHFSLGNTFKGPNETPIVDELNIISRYLSKFNLVTVLVDDMRSFPFREITGYPPKKFLVDWAEINNLHWHIEYDIFIAQKK